MSSSAAVARPTTSTSPPPAISGLALWSMRSRLGRSWLGRGGRRGRLSVGCLANSGGAACDDAVKPLDPATPLVVVVPKTFTTAETLANMSGAIDWLQAAGISDPHGRLIGVTANPEAALDADIDETRILAFGGGVGGGCFVWGA